MVPKKSKKADLESKRNVFVMLGLVLALAATLFAFEWNSQVEQVSSLGEVVAAEVEDEFIPVTREDQVIEQTAAPEPVVVEMLNIVDDDTEIEEELVIEDTEADEETVITIAPVIAQEEEEVEDTKVWVSVDEKPEFPGGNEALTSFLHNNVKYPPIAQENGIQGTVLLTFVVDEKGNVTNIQVVRSITDALDKEALRVMNMMPQWKPGMQGGKAVKVHYQQAITFRLE